MSFSSKSVYNGCSRLLFGNLNRRVLLVLRWTVQLMSKLFELSYISCLTVDNATDGGRFRDPVTCCAPVTFCWEDTKECCMGCYVVRSAES